MNKYVISVIIPVYNSERWIERCINSIINQSSFKKIEMIIVDDGSTDKSFELCEKYKKKHTNIKLIKIENSGVSNARNQGLKIATGKYISFVDSDDWVEKDFYEKCIENIRNNLCEIICYGSFINYVDKEIHRCSPEKKIISPKQYLYELYMKNYLDQTVTNKVFKAEILKNISFDTKIKIGEDYLFFIEALLNSKNIMIENESMYHYFMNDNSAMRKKFNSSKFDSITVCDEVTNKVNQKYPEMKEILLSSKIDYLCRILCEIQKDNLQKEYYKMYEKIKKEIHNYSITKKYKYSSKKHFITYILTRISPKIYNFLKETMKMQYR